MESTPYISLIVPVYNVEKYLPECLDSILHWTFTNWEAILIDDGSLDYSGTICDEYANKDVRFKVIHKQNEGVSIARNVGLDIAKGEWCWFVDSDDVIDSNIFVNNSILEDKDIVMYDIQSYNDGDVIPSQNGDGSIEECSNLNSFYMNHISWTHPTLWYHKKFWIKNGKYVIRFSRDVRLGEDGEFMRKCEFLSNNPVKINYTCYYYRLRQGSATHNPQKNKIVIDDALKVSGNIYSFIKQYNINPDKWKILRIATIVKSIPTHAVKSRLWKCCVIKLFKTLVAEYQAIGYDLVIDRTIMIAAYMPRLDIIVMMLRSILGKMMDSLFI